MGQWADITQAQALVAGYQASAVLADRGYDADAFISLLQKVAIEVVIPSKKNRLEERLIDKISTKIETKWCVSLINSKFIAE